jgi:hypothetical protein
MSYLVAGIVVLAGLLLLGKWFVSVDPKALAKFIKPLLIAAGIGLVLFLVVTGKLVWVFWTLPFLVPLFVRWRREARMARNASRMASGGASGMASEVASEFLDMRLDHDSGDMDGIVRKGRHEGRYLSALGMNELFDLYADYSNQDSESARLLAAFLDRMHPEWRDADGHGSSEGETAFEESGGAMSRDEAFRILGLPGDAGEPEIKAAHHRLIAGLHPDRGGSAYLAAKINEARDVLLKS